MLTLKQRYELHMVYRALVQIRSLTWDIEKGVAAPDAVKQIERLANALHDVPNAIAHGRDVDPDLFRRILTAAGLQVDPLYPHGAHLDPLYATFG